MIQHPGRALGALALVLLAHLPARAQAPQNLQVLPDDIPRPELIAIMGQFARALGVRCNYCHVEVERDGRIERDMAADDKATKRVAREMMRMVASINERLAQLPQRADPPVNVQCATCHRGATRPRMLQDTLLIAHDAGGRDSMIAVYRTLRERYYGRAAYDFSELALADVGAALLERDLFADATAAHALNVEMNPQSDFALREHARAAVLAAFVEEGAVEGTRAFRRLHQEYGERAFPPATLNRVGYDLLGLEAAQDAVAVFRLNVAAHPQDANAYDSLAEAMLAAGDTTGAITNYRRAAELDPRNTEAATIADRLERARN